MPLEQPLLDILACPIDKQGLLYYEGDAVLYNPRLRRIYRIRDGYPVMLASRAEPTSDEDHRRLLKQAAHGEAVGTAGEAAESIYMRINATIWSLSSRVPGPSDTTNNRQYHTSNPYYPH